MELIKTTSFDEFMTEYYELNNTSNTDTNGSVTKSEYEVDKESGIITRREFLKYSALGTATVIMGASTERAEAVVPFLVLGAIALASSAWASDEFIDWRITIGNDSYRDTLRESGGFVLVSESDFDELDTTYANFTVPPRKARTYRNTSLRANVNRDIQAVIHANVGGHRTKSCSFRIKQG